MRMSRAQWRALWVGLLLVALVACGGSGGGSGDDEDDDQGGAPGGDFGTLDVSGPDTAGDLDDEFDPNFTGEAGVAPNIVVSFQETTTGDLLNLNLTNGVPTQITITANASTFPDIFGYLLSCPAGCPGVAVDVPGQSVEFDDVVVPPAAGTPNQQATDDITIDGTLTWD